MFLYNCIFIAWDPPAENALFVEYYILYYKKTESENWNDCCKPIRKTANLCTSVNGFQPGMEYNLMLLAVNKNGHCSDGAYMQVKTKPESWELGCYETFNCFSENDVLYHSAKAFKFR